MTDRPIHELVDLVRDHKIDPWDVDIEKLTSVYLEKIRLMKELDIRVPARVLLSAALLLHMKSTNAINGNGNGNGKALEEELEELLEMELPDFNTSEISLIQFVPRKITMGDLMGSLKLALKEIPDKKEKLATKLERVIWRGEEMDSLFRPNMERLMTRIKQLIQEGTTATLMTLARKRTRAEVTLTFLLLLFLAADGKVSLDQPDLFGDIFVKLQEVKKDGNPGR